ncbi:porin [Trinickia terrae]|uniref:Porin n=1 Tax=Trinickia terrae TaxID=2571161 RepID=A0A4U1HZB7_9BURK|nr:porin [Trinickia terrae]TKC86228.1 porin [Trinickia terrae]
MKKTLIVAAVSASFAVAAHAQSSVTLYGVLDAGITYQSNVNAGTAASPNGKSLWRMGSGIDQSRWGLRGSEDLGGGLKAIFNLESGFNIGNGDLANNGGMFNRQAFVGLSSGYGTVTLGRQYDSLQDYLAPLTATGTWGGTYFAHPGNFDGLNTNGGFSVNNSIKFASANYAGFTFGGTYGFSNNTNFTNNREYSAGAAYQYQGLRVGLAYAQQNNPNAQNPAGQTNGGASSGGEFLGYASNFRLRTFGAGAGYTFGPAEVGVAWTQARVDNIASGVLAGSGFRQNNYEVNGKYNLTPALGLGLAYTFTTENGSGTANSFSTRFHQIGAQADYSLSKRTDVYAQVVYQHAMGDVPFASIYNGDITTPSSTSPNQTAATIGLRHRF